MVNQGDVKRFWAKVKKGPKHWLWLGKGRVGCPTGPQYGVHIMNGVPTTAHRAAWQIQRGPIPKGQCVLHRCDIPLCVRGSCLFLGTRAQNTADMVKKGRQARGAQKRNAVFTERSVREVRRRYVAGQSPTEMARERNVSLRTIWDIIQRRRWAWVK